MKKGTVPQTWGARGGRLWDEGSEMKPTGNFDPLSEGNVSVAQKQIFWNLMNSNRNKEFPMVRISVGPNHLPRPSDY